MKKIIPVVMICVSFASFAKVDVSKVYGRIKIVDSFPDYKVKIVNSFSDLKVQKVDAFANSAGRWQIVDSFPDYKIQIVESFPDFTIQYVSSFPGVNKKTAIKRFDHLY